ncbi:CpsD/CapB family tyrosine-protein kinase [candidate division CSSED10-310 bacterium]|uniref:CpsD/CapB family tyrosine-protein kinase n=1 Tax=candidate division CSSED10-310 bacterium TaxID=2855610 RepID=A0ABV6Z1P2_UNCC1
MKNKSSLNHKFTIVINEIALPSSLVLLERKIALWFPNLEPEAITRRVRKLPFSIKNLTHKVAHKIRKDLIQIGCAVEIHALDADNDDLSLDFIDGNFNPPPLKPPSHVRNFFSSSYLTSFVHPKSHASEAFRTLRTNFQFLRSTRDIQTILVTSSGEKEGKSTISSNLAISLSQSGIPVLLIDGDLRKPNLHRAFGYDNNIGLTNVLTGKAELKDCIFATFINNLSVLLAGPIPPNPAELLALDTMRDVMQALKRRFEIIVFDSPPVTSVSDPMIMSSVVDGVYLVIFAGKTSKKMALHALESLRGVKANILGVVLNSFRFQSHYYYQYYYKYYYEDQKKHKSSNDKKTSALGQILSAMRKNKSDHL